MTEEASSGPLRILLVDDNPDDRALVERTLRHGFPGVIIQPSGFFAVIEAQRSGCHFFPAAE